MKKLLSLILSAMLVMSTSAIANVASAQTLNALGESEAKPVKVIASECTTVYRVDITWESLEYQYKFTTWDPASLTYNGTNGWVDDTQTITVVNRSNAPIELAPKFEGTVSATATKNGVTANVASSDANLSLGSADATGVTSSNLPTKILNVKVSGEPQDKGAFTIGNVVVEIKAPQA